MLALWLRAEDRVRLEDKEGNGSHDRRHSAGGGSVGLCVCVWEGGVDMGTPHVSIPRQRGMRKTQSSLGNSGYRFKGCS